MLFARASLKHVLDQAQSLPGPQLPRAFCAGLIEAGGRCSGSQPEPTELPRAFCAGLIEAYVPFSVFSGLPHCYPVLFARASLKPGPLDPHAWPPDPLPRAFCAGLIEALTHVSVKRARWTRLPRAFCAGLIEARPSYRMLIGATALPRAFCAGLIEAGNAITLVNIASSVTPCFLRGPH